MATWSDYYTGGSYGTPGTNQFGQPSQTLQQQFLAANPDVAYRNFLDQIPGLGFGQDPRSQFYQQSYSRLNQQFQADLPNLPIDTTFTDWLGTNGLPKLQAQWGSLAPSQRNENVGMFQGRLRWL